MRWVVGYLASWQGPFLAESPTSFGTAPANREGTVSATHVNTLKDVTTPDVERHNDFQCLIRAWDKEAAPSTQLSRLISPTCTGINGP